MKAFQFLLCLATALLCGCETLPRPPAIPLTGDPVVDGRAQLAAAPEKDRQMWRYRTAASALRRANWSEAREQLDNALPLAGGLMGPSREAAKARSLFGKENTKIFVGEPYERVMAFYYRAILYWMQGEPDNARACYKSAQLADAVAEEEQHQADYVLLSWLEAQAAARLHADPSDALANARRLAGHQLPDPDPQDNVLIFAEYGRGPIKYSDGEYNQRLRFTAPPSGTRSARLRIGAHTIPLPPYDDLLYQATTRGGRTMDYILGNKAVFKRNTDTAGEVALTGSLIAAHNIRRRDGTKNRDAENVALALGALGLVSKLTSAATTPQADTRAWNNLPRYLSFAAMRLPAGRHEGLLEFLDQAGQPVSRSTRTVHIEVDPLHPCILFLSELTR